jgi:uncharacterized UPF0160 family protein
MNIESKPKFNKIETVATHGGLFHTDEVFAIAIMKDLFPEKMELHKGGSRDFIQYLRLQDRGRFEQLKKSTSTAVLDAGQSYDFDNYNLDHHQPGGAGKRENGIDMATAGLVWKHWGHEWIDYIDTYRTNQPDKTKPKNLQDVINNNILAPEQRLEQKLTEEEKELIWKKIDKNYVQFIDATDTGQLAEIEYTLSTGEHIPGSQTFTLSEATRLFNIDCHDGRNAEDRFKSAVEFFRSMILGMVNKYIDVIEASRMLQPENLSFNSDGTTVVIDQTLSAATAEHLLEYDDRFKHVKFYASTTGNGGYYVHAAMEGEGTRMFRSPDKIPQELRLGNSQVDQIATLIGSEPGTVGFVHGAGHMALCKTKEAAEKLLEYCMNHE